MAVTTLTSREFNQDTSGAKKAARRGPVFITDRGRPAHVLLTIEDYRRLTGGEMSLAEALASQATRISSSSHRALAAAFSNRPISSDVPARHQCYFRAQATEE